MTRREEIEALEVKLTDVPDDGTSLTSEECLTAKTALEVYERAERLLWFKEMRLETLEADRVRYLQHEKDFLVNETDAVIVPLKNEIRILKAVVHG